ncbi:hypothetical protein EJ04DRAFT_261130 [Polyplosphaeria fusca]|uniref:Uncharacterized protein n=1 Tax=Polyplosphaeria fusca TaxID=682080 RepID=A0A9P4R6D9_9PLEO|nr:hypothetical protein EJ04DRAFT_261130 [Polyplosphaeria fusca]
MVLPTRQNRFAPFSRTPSLRRLKTAFSPTRLSARSRSPSSSSTASGTTTSPLTRTSSPASNHSANSIRHLLALRRKPSVLDVELEEERSLFGHEVIEVLEPRPWGRGEVEVGIFEVLEGRC